LKTSCIETERIGDVLEMAADHPERLHLESCPRCRNLVRAYSAFMRAESPSGARPDAARAHLADVIRRAAGEMESRSPAPRPRGFSFRRLRPAHLGLAAAVVVVLAAVAVWRNRGPEAPLLRNEPVRESGAFSLLPAVVEPDGTVRLAWEPAPRAEHYEVRVYGPELDEIYIHPPVIACAIALDLADLPVTPDAPGLVWRVYALRAGDVVGISTPGSIPLR